jgi:predicted  nucleic acid-binding Zn-ribbon protein
MTSKLWMGSAQDCKDQMTRLEDDLQGERGARAAELASHEAAMSQLSARLAAAEGAVQAHRAELEARRKVHEEDRSAADTSIQHYKSQVEVLVKQLREEVRKNIPNTVRSKGILVGLRGNAAPNR